jgi:hypothetical protein
MIKRKFAVAGTLMVCTLMILLSPLSSSQENPLEGMPDNSVPIIGDYTPPSDTPPSDTPPSDTPLSDEDMLMAELENIPNITSIMDEEILLYGAPDLIIQDLSLSIENTETAVLLYATATVANIGDRVAEDAEVNFYMGHQDPERGFSSKTLTLPPGTKKELMTFWAISDTNANIFVIADPDYKIKEYDDENNMIMKPASQAWIGGPIGREEEVTKETPIPLPVFALLGVIIIALLVLIKFSKKKINLVVPESLYSSKKEKKNVYALREEQTKDGKKRRIYAPFSAEESFLTSVDLNDKDKKLSDAIVATYNIPQDYADAIAISKRLNAVLLVDQKQTWVQRVGDELKLNTKTVF